MPSANKNTYLSSTAIDREGSTVHQITLEHDEVEMMVTSWLRKNTEFKSLLPKNFKFAWEEGNNDDSNLPRLIVEAEKV